MNKKPKRARPVNINYLDSPPEPKEAEPEWDDEPYNDGPDEEKAKMEGRKP